MQKCGLPAEGNTKYESWHLEIMQFAKSRSDRSLIGVMEFSWWQANCWRKECDVSYGLLIELVLVIRSFLNWHIYSSEICRLSVLYTETDFPWSPQMICRYFPTLFALSWSMVFSEIMYPIASLDLLENFTYHAMLDLAFAWEHVGNDLETRLVVSTVFFCVFHFLKI